MYSWLKQKKVTHKSNFVNINVVPSPRIVDIAKDMTCWIISILDKTMEYSTVL